MNSASIHAKSPLSYFFVQGKSEILFGSKLKSFIGIYWWFKKTTKNYGFWVWIFLSLGRGLRVGFWGVENFDVGILILNPADNASLSLNWNGPPGFSTSQKNRISLVVKPTENYSELTSYVGDRRDFGDSCWWQNAPVKIRVVRLQQQWLLANIKTLTLNQCHQCQNFVTNIFKFTYSTRVA